MASDDEDASEAITIPPLAPLAQPPSIAQSLFGAIASAFTSVAGFVTTHIVPFGGGEYDKRRMADAIAKLQSNLAFLDGKIESMQASCERYTGAARVLYRAQNKTAAVHQIRLKKMYEREIRKMESLKFNIESNILHIESVGVMMETVCTIKETSEHFQIVQRHVDISKLENTIEEMCEQRDASQDIESILNDMHNADRYEDDELLKELEDLVNVPSDDDGSASGVVAEPAANDAAPTRPTSPAGAPPPCALVEALDSVPPIPTSAVEPAEPTERATERETARPAIQAAAAS